MYSTPHKSALTLQLLYMSMILLTNHLGVHLRACISHNHIVQVLSSASVTFPSDAPSVQCLHHAGTPDGGAAALTFQITCCEGDGHGAKL